MLDLEQGTENVTDNDQDQVDDQGAEDQDTDNDDQEQSEEEQEEDPSDDEEGATDQDESDDGEEETELTLDDKPLDRQNSNSSFRNLRDAHKKQKEENRKLKEQLRALQGGTETSYQQESFTLPPKPTYASCDYDEEKFQQETDKWYNKKEKINQAKKKQESETQQIVQELNERAKHYNSGVAELKVKDFDIAEESVRGRLSIEQQNNLLFGADNPAGVVYVLGKNPSELERLSKIKNPSRFGAELAKLEARIKRKPSKKPSVKPERIPKGNSGAPGSKQAQYEKLRAQGIKKGDLTAAIQFKRANNL